MMWFMDHVDIAALVLERDNLLLQVQMYQASSTRNDAWSLLLAAHDRWFHQSRQFHADTIQYFRHKLINQRKELRRLNRRVHDLTHHKRFGELKDQPAVPVTRG